MTPLAFLSILQSADTLKKPANGEVLISLIGHAQTFVSACLQFMNDGAQYFTKTSLSPDFECLPPPSRTRAHSVPMLREVRGSHGTHYEGYYSLLEYNDT